MKKLLCILLIGSGLSASALDLILQNRGAFDLSGNYKIYPLQGTDKSVGAMVTSAGKTFYANGSANPTVGTLPAADSAWTAMTGESYPAALANGSIFVGDAGNSPVARAVSGAITISNTGVTSATQASFFTTNTGTINNTLTGGQTRYGTGAFGITAANAESSVAVTFGTACTTSVYSIVATVVEASNTVPLLAKVKTVTTSGATILVDNLSGSTASAAGTVNYQVICH